MRTEKHFITQSPNNGARHYGLDTGLVIVKLGDRSCCDSRFDVFPGERRFSVKFPGIPSPNSQLRTPARVW